MNIKKVCKILVS